MIAFKKRKWNQAGDSSFLAASSSQIEMGGFQVMGREQMRNLEVFRSTGSQINEFEFQKHQGEITEQEHGDKQRGGTKRPTQAEHVKQVMMAAHKKVVKKRKKQAAKTVSSKRVSRPNKKAKDKL